MYLSNICYNYITGYQFFCKINFMKLTELSEDELEQRKRKTTREMNKLSAKGKNKLPQF